MILHWFDGIDWAVFWSALQAVGTVGALLLLTWEVARSRREDIRYRWEGFKYASDFIVSDRFLSSYHSLIEATRFDDADMLADAVYGALEQVEILGRLAEEKYVDKDLFISIYRVFLFRIREAVTDIDHRLRTEELPVDYPVGPQARLSEMRRLFPFAWRLLRDIRTLPELGEARELKDEKGGFFASS